MNKLTNKLVGIIAALAIILGMGAGILPGDGNPNLPTTPGTSDNGDKQPGNEGNTDGQPGENGNGASSPNCDLGEEEFNDD